MVPDYQAFWKHSTNVRASQQKNIQKTERLPQNYTKLIPTARKNSISLLHHNFHPWPVGRSPKMWPSIPHPNLILLMALHSCSKKLTFSQNAVQMFREWLLECFARSMGISKIWTLFGELWVNSVFLYIYSLKHLFWASEWVLFLRVGCFHHGLVPYRKSRAQSRQTAFDGDLRRKLVSIPYILRILWQSRRARWWFAGLQQVHPSIWEYTQYYPNHIKNMSNESKVWSPNKDI